MRRFLALLFLVLILLLGGLQLLPAPQAAVLARPANTLGLPAGELAYLPVIMGHGEPDPNATPTLPPPTATATPTITPTPTATPTSTPTYTDWAVDSCRYRLPVTAGMNDVARKDKPGEFAVNFTAMLASDDAVFDRDSLRVVEVDENNTVLNNQVPFQFDPAPSYSAETNAAGTVVILLEGDSDSEAVRHYHVYFDELNGDPDTPASVIPRVILTEDALDEGLDSYEIKTDSTTYYYHKDGGGFSSLLDTEGIDWINYNDKNGAAGEFRGIPNLVQPDDGGYFHPGHSGVISSVQALGPLKATILSTTTDGKWETLWEIYPDHARLTVLKADAAFWFLYEGTPGGRLRPGNDYSIRSDGTKSRLELPWNVDIPEPEWLYFASRRENRSLYFVHHEDDTLIDSYSELDRLMTVFGFGRKHADPYMIDTPAHFTLGFAEDVKFDSVEPVIDNAFQPLVITLETAEQQY